MTEATRQQRRREMREQAKLGRDLLAAGLPWQPRREEVLAVARVVHAKLAERDNERRAGEAAALAQDLFERSLASRPKNPRIACARGCNHCCHQLVGAVPPEIFRIAAVVRSTRRSGLDVNGVIARSRPLVGLGVADRVGRRLACPLLVDGLCSVYAERPLVCRQTTSYDVSACLDELDGRDLDKPIEVSPVHLDIAGSASVVVLGAMRAAGLPTEAYELAAALSIVLADAGAERRWLAGEPLFAGLAPVAGRSAEIEVVAGRIADALR